MSDTRDRAVLGDYRSSGKDKRKSTRSVVKGNHISSKGSGKKVGDSLGYYATRQNSKGERQDRDVFTKDADKVLRREAMNDLRKETKEQKYSLSYRIVMSPDTARDTSPEALREWTREMMRKIEANHDVYWVAVAHTKDNAHTQHAHVHVVAVVDKRLSKDELATLRQHGDVHWQDIKSREAMLERESFQPSKYQQQRELRRERAQGNQQQPQEKEAISKSVAPSQSPEF
ncbi:MAG: relaxase/mobilization nuclease domain-containing protein [Trueperaceae bacterium]